MSGSVWNIAFRRYKVFCKHFGRCKFSKTMWKMLHSCKYCGRRHKEGYVCKRKPIEKKKIDDAVRRRNTADWKYIRKKIKRRDNYFYQNCIRNLYEARKQCNFENLQVHHTVPINTDKSLSFASSNLLTLCPMHHHMCDNGEIYLEEVKGTIEEQEKTTKLK